MKPHCSISPARNCSECELRIKSGKNTCPYGLLDSTGMEAKMEREAIEGYRLLEETIFGRKEKA